MPKINNIEVDESFMETVIKDSQYEANNPLDVRKGWEKAKAEGRIVDSWYVAYDRLIKFLEESLYLAGVKTDKFKYYDTMYVTDLENRLEAANRSNKELLKQVKFKEEMLQELLHTFRKEGQVDHSHLGIRDDIFVDHHPCE